MSTTADKAKQVLTGASYAISVLEAIGALSGGVLGKVANIEEYANALTAIQTAVNTVMKGLDGQATPAAIDDALAYLRAKIQSNDLAADQSVDAKFPKG